MRLHHRDLKAFSCFVDNLTVVVQMIKRVAYNPPANIMILMILWRT